jgi:putative transposase
LILEALRFLRRMGRLIQTFGERYIKERLGRLQEIYGIEVEEVNSAYSRQECSSCGYVDRENRKGMQELWRQSKRTRR